MSNEEAPVIQVVCRRRRHVVATVTEEHGTRWLEMKRAGAHYGLGIDGAPDRVPLTPLHVNRAGCPDCGRHGLLDHFRIVEAIRKYDAAGLPRGHRRRVMKF